MTGQLPQPQQPDYPRGPEWSGTPTYEKAMKALEEALDWKNQLEKAVKSWLLDHSPEYRAQVEAERREAARIAEGRRREAELLERERQIRAAAENAHHVDVWRSHGEYANPRAWESWCRTCRNTFGTWNSLSEEVIRKAAREHTEEKVQEQLSLFRNRSKPN